jgi:hypothetical protein
VCLNSCAEGSRSGACDLDSRPHEPGGRRSHTCPGWRRGWVESEAATKTGSCEPEPEPVEGTERHRRPRGRDTLHRIARFFARGAPAKATGASLGPVLTLVCATFQQDHLLRSAFLVVRLHGAIKARRPPTASKKPQGPPRRPPPPLVPSLHSCLMKARSPPAANKTARPVLPLFLRTYITLLALQTPPASCQPSSRFPQFSGLFLRPSTGSDLPCLASLLAM